jgi:hypothetical protein
MVTGLRPIARFHHHTQRYAIYGHRRHEVASYTVTGVGRAPYLLTWQGVDPTCQASTINIDYFHIVIKERAKLQR